MRTYDPDPQSTVFRPLALYAVRFAIGPEVRVRASSREHAIARARAEFPDRPSVGPVATARKVRG